MIGAVKQRGLQAKQRITRQNTVLHLLSDAFFNGRDVLLRNDTTNDFVNKFETFYIAGLEPDNHVTILATTTGLFHELVVDLDSRCDLFTIGHLRLTDVCVNAEFTTHTVDNNVEMQFTHAGNNGLTG